MSDKIEYSRLIQKRFSQPGVVPTIPVSGATTLSQLVYTDLLIGEIAFNLPDKRMWFRAETEIVEIFGVSGGTYANLFIEGDSDTSINSIANNDSGGINSGEYNFTVGEDNSTFADNSAVIAGFDNIINIDSDNSAIIGGNGNIISGATNVIMLGCENTVAFQSGSTYVQNLVITDVPSTGNTNTDLVLLRGLNGAVTAVPVSDLPSGGDFLKLDGTSQMDVGASIVFDKESFSNAKTYIENTGIFKEFIDPPQPGDNTDSNNAFTILSTARLSLGANNQEPTVILDIDGTTSRQTLSVPDTTFEVGDYIKINGISTEANPTDYLGLDSNGYVRKVAVPSGGTQNLLQVLQTGSYAEYGNTAYNLGEDGFFVDGAQSGKSYLLDVNNLYTQISRADDFNSPDSSSILLNSSGMRFESNSDITFGKDVVNNKVIYDGTTMKVDDEADYIADATSDSLMPKSYIDSLTGGTGGGPVTSYNQFPSGFDNNAFYDDGFLEFSWNAPAGRPEIKMLVEPSGNGDMRSLAIRSDGTAQNTFITQPNLTYSLFTPGVTSGDRCTITIGAEDDPTFPFYNVTIYNLGSSFNTSFIIEKIN